MEEIPIIMKAAKTDAGTLQRIQYKSFEPDLVTYGDDERCPANESIESILYNIENCDYYKIMLFNTIVGGFKIGKYDNDTYRLKRIFIDPDMQSKGIGTFVMKALDKLYPDAKKWTLDTPFKNYRNHHFYEKFGFRKTSENKIDDKLILFEYERKGEY